MAAFSASLRWASGSGGSSERPRVSKAPSSTAIFSLDGEWSLPSLAWSKVDFPMMVPLFRAGLADRRSTRKSDEGDQQRREVERDDKENEEQGERRTGRTKKGDGEGSDELCFCITEEAETRPLSSFGSYTLLSTVRHKFLLPSTVCRIPRPTTCLRLYRPSVPPYHAVTTLVSPGLPKCRSSGECGGSTMIHPIGGC